MVYKRNNRGAKLVLLEFKEKDISYGGQRNDVGKGSVGLLVKDLCESVDEIQKRSDRMMIMCLIFGEEIIWMICVYASQSGKPDIQKDKFYD